MCDFQSKFHQISWYFANFFDIIGKRQSCKFKVVLDEIFFDKYGNFDLDIADALSASGERNRSAR